MHSVFTEKNETVLISNYDKRVQPVHLIETHAYETGNDPVSEYNIEGNNKIKQKKTNFDDDTKENIK